MPGKFVFRFQPLLDLRERVEAEKRRAFAHAARASDESRCEIDRLAERHGACARALHDCAIGRFPWSLPVHDAHLRFLTRTMATRQQLHAELRAARERASAALVLANRERRVVEKLKERRRREFENDEARRDELELDEANARPRPSTQLVLSAAEGLRMTGSG